MANIEIHNLPTTEFGFAELSNLESESIVGGGWFKRLTGISTPSFLKKLDDVVRENIPGGWLTVIQLASGNGGNIGWMSRDGEGP
jgi:hypothetical protein